MMHAHFRTFARYNDWANRLIYAAAATLTDADYRADRGAFFRSIHGTLNHVLVGDRIWLRRLTGEGAVADSLDAILYDDLPALRAAREREDQRIIAYVDGLDDTTLQGNVTFTNSRGETFEQGIATILAHFFNHQTHHRGQVHALLTGLGAEGPEIDLIFYLRGLMLAGKDAS